MTVDDAPTNNTDVEESPAEEGAAGNESSPVAASEAPAQAAAPVAVPEAPTEETATEAPAKPAAEASDAPPKQAAEEPEPKPEPVFDPDSCKAIAIGLPAFSDAALDGEFDGTDFQYYLEPAGVLNGPLVCTRAPENEPERAGLLMTRAGWQAKKVCLDDGVNPETYELSFPKEFGYVKTLSHYQPQTRKSAKYPWSKKY